MEDVYFYNLLGKVGDILYKCPVSKWQSPRNLTSWNSPFSFISEGSFGRRRSRARSLIRPGFTIMICVKMHQETNKLKHPQSLTFLKKSTTLSIVVKDNLARKTLNQPSGGQLLILKKYLKQKEEAKRSERFLKNSPKVNGKVTTPVSRSMLIRAPTPRDPDGSKMLFLGEIKFF